MLLIEALGALQYLKKELISLTDLGNILGLGRAAMSGRIQRKSELKIDEIKKLENFYNIDLQNFNPVEKPITDEAKQWFNDMIRKEFEKRGL